MADIDVEAIRARADRATPGPWDVGGQWLWDDPREADEEFIAHAREDIPALLDALEAAEAKLQAILDLHTGLPWCRCAHDGHLWPCQTVRIIQGDTDG